MLTSHIVAAIAIAVGFAAVMLLAEPALPLVVVTATSATVGGLFVVFWFFGTHLPLRRFLPLRERFGFTAKEDNPCLLIGTWQGVPVNIEYHEATKSRRACLSIHLFWPLPAVPDCTFQRESFAPRLAKAIGLSKEKQANDPLFDPMVYSESDDDEALAPHLMEPGLRAELRSLLEIPRTTVRLDPSGVGMLIGGHFGWRRYFRPEVLQEILGRLAAVSRHAEVALRDGSPALRQRRSESFPDGASLGERIALLRHPPVWLFSWLAYFCFSDPRSLFGGCAINRSPGAFTFTPRLSLRSPCLCTRRWLFH